MKLKALIIFVFIFSLFSFLSSSYAEQMKLTGKIDIMYQYQMYFYKLYNDGPSDVVFLGSNHDIEDENFIECIEEAGYGEHYAQVIGDFKNSGEGLALNHEQSFSCQIIDQPTVNDTIEQAVQKTAPIKIEAYEQQNSVGLTGYKVLQTSFRIKITSIVDSVTIKNILINRGNVKWRMRTTEFTGSDFKAINLPKQLLFGKSLEISLSEQPLEVKIATDLGEWVLTY